MNNAIKKLFIIVIPGMFLVLCLYGFVVFGWQSIQSKSFDFPVLIFLIAAIYLLWLVVRVARIPVEDMPSWSDIVVAHLPHNGNPAAELLDESRSLRSQPSHFETIVQAEIEKAKQKM
jgi:hypothetical protein